MTESVQKVLESFGHRYEHMGASYNTGRCFALAMLATEPLSQEDFATELGISQSVVSTSLRPLLELELLEKTRVPGSRATHYEIPANAATVSARVNARRMAILKTLLREAAELSLPEVARARIQEHLEFYDYIEAGVKELLDRWEARRKEGRAPRRRGAQPRRKRSSQD